MDPADLKTSLLAKFVELTQDRLQAIQLGALELEKPGAAASADAVARELHTMKGEARMLGLAAVGQLAHACEDLLKAHREGRVDARATTDTLLHGCDAVADLLEDPGASRAGTPASAAMAARLAAASRTPLPPLHPGGARPAPPRASPGLPAASPPPSAASAGEPPRTGPEGERVADRSVRVRFETLDVLGLLAGDLLVESARAGLLGEELQALLQRFSRLGDHLLRLLDGAGLEEEGRRRVALAESDLHLLRDDAFRFVRSHGDGIDTLHHHLTQLADQVAEARLVPLSTVFEAFPRALRELAHAQGKRLELVLENADAGVDRSLVADVREALVHLIRNAVDHGVEAPATRLALGKAEVGRVTLKARVAGDLVSVEVRDDGRGIDPAALRQVAVQRRVLGAAQAAALSEREAMELIFRPGFTTREEVSDLSGRGVGLDVVKRKVEGLGGSVAVASQVGRGTTVTLRLPQSLALMRVLLVRLGDDVYGMPASDVEAVARFGPQDRVELMGTVAVLHRQRPITLAALGPLLGLNGGPRFERPPCVVVRHGEELAALVVDGFVDEREVAVKPVGGDFLKGAPLVAGSAALEDGRIAVLLHVPDLMAEVRRLGKPAAEPAAARRLAILLVDDSPIARATESALVRALGHEVEEALDGEDAWARLQDTPFDVVLTDVQMPRLDGFALTRRIKEDPRWAELPVVILSSLASPEDKRRGLDAGADAYLIKGELGVETLALTLDRLR